jgi:hypothetical protein
MLRTRMIIAVSWRFIEEGVLNASSGPNDFGAEPRERSERRLQHQVERQSQTSSARPHPTAGPAMASFDTRHPMSA